jgi:phage protein D/phage baseplate assembly protein gpV
LTDTTRLLSQFYVTLDGAPASEAMLNNLVDATVESSLHLPDAATITLHDPDGKWVDEATLAPGKTLKITAKIADSKADLFDGEIVEIESDFVPGDRRVVVRAFDRLHRLARGRHVRSFLQVTDGDIVNKIAQECGLQARVGPTSTVHKYVLQDNVTNLEFLRARAAALGYLLYVDEKTLHFEALGAHKASIELEYGGALREFHPRLSTIDQISSATARGWDPTQRKEVVGRASSAKSAPQVGTNGQGGDVAKDAFGMTAELLVADRPIRTQVVADKLAQATLDRRVGRFIEAEGIAAGTPPLGAAVSVKLSNLGQRFSGTYFVTGAVHRYDSSGGYSTRFQVSGFKPSTLLNLLSVERDGAPAPREGLVIGVVTDNVDPDGQCRVKVKYPWLSSEHASDWARVVTPGGGPQRGLEFLPEVNDEVLVGFEHGDVNYPYVLGGLWNGKDAPPKKNDEIVGGGKVKQRVIRSRTGHIIILDDSDDQPSISIVDKTGKNSIKLDSKSNKLTVHLEGDMLFEAPSGDVTVKGKTVNLEATNEFKIKGKSVDASADQGLKMKGMNAEVEASSSVKVKGATADVTASGKMTLDGGQMAELKATMVKIN